jgi:hypothetical protein
MATYTEGMQARHRVGAMVWLAVVAFAVAAVLVIALVATQAGSPAPVQPGIGQTQDQPVGPSTGGDFGKHAVPLGNGICARCAP